MERLVSTYLVLRFESSGTHPAMVSSSYKTETQLWHLQHVVMVTSRATACFVSLGTLGYSFSFRRYC